MSAYIMAAVSRRGCPDCRCDCRCITQFAAFATHPRRWGYCLLFMGRLWQGRHNSRTPCETCVPGFPPSPWEAVRKSHYSPYRSMRTGCCPGLQGLYVDRSTSLSIWSPFHRLASWRRTLSRCCMVFVPAIPCIQFSKYNERHEVRALHLTQGNSRFLNSENCRTPIVHSLFTIFSMISKQA